MRGHMSIWDYWALPGRYRAILREILEQEDREVELSRLRSH